MTRVEVQSLIGGTHTVSVDNTWAASFNNEPDAQEYAARKRDEIAKAQAYRAHDYAVWNRSGGQAVTIRHGQMPNGTPGVWQTKLLDICAALLNTGDVAVLDRVHGEVVGQ